MSEDKYKDIKFGITKDFEIISHTDNPGELLSVAGNLMHKAIITIEGYFNQYPENKIEGTPVTHEALRNKLMEVLQAYHLVESGMDADEAMNIIGMDKKHYKVMTTEDMKKNEDNKKDTN